METRAATDHALRLHSDAGWRSLYLQDSSSNWPYDAAAGNTATAGAVLWSGASVALLLFALAMILYFYHRYRLAPVDVEGATLCVRCRIKSVDTYRNGPLRSSLSLQCFCFLPRPC